MFEKVLIPLDGSRFSGRALPYAIEIAKRFGGKVILLQVVHPTPVTVPTAGGDAMVSSATIQAIEQSAKAQDKRNIAHANRYLSSKLQEVNTTGASGTYHVVLGEPANAIISFCQKESVDLVVMTTSGKSGLKRAILGSVADEVIREPGIPVLAIRPERRRKKIGN